ncbi:MAG: 30S ribosomal protein S6 [Lachnospiraceae bacterium]|nr:30S ribosomal protein S6 [Lachnospiraceae bacterium]
MNKYELAVAINGKLDESEKNEAFDKVKALIERFGGQITAVDDWGKRRYAYEVHKTKEGYYSFIKFQAEPEVPVEIEQRIRIMDFVHRYLIVSDEKELTVKHEEAEAPKAEEKSAEDAAPAAAEEAPKAPEPEEAPADAEAGAPEEA